MRIKTIFQFFLFFVVAMGLPCHGITSDPCFSPGECIDSFLVDVLLTNDEYECLELCSNEETCGWFTYFPNSLACQLYQNCTNIDIQHCEGCLTGQGDCIPEEPQCWIQGECQGQVLFSEEVSTEDECLRLCKAQRGCQWFSFVLPDSPCILFSDCNEFDESSEDCISGERRCNEDVETSTTTTTTSTTTTTNTTTTTSPVVDQAWHMLIGGSGYTSYFLNTVQLFNWATGEQCQLAKIPVEVAAHSGELFNGVPIFCGGDIPFGNEKYCYSFNKETGNWEKDGILLATIVYAGSVIVPSQGWLIYGGVDSPRSTAQQLKSLDSQWVDGPPLYEDRADVNQCIVQLNDTTTVFFGGRYHPANVISFNWDSMSYTKHSALLKSDRAYGACALLKPSDSESLVVVASGRSKGIEAWNPVTDQVTFLDENFPTASGNNGITPKLVPIKEGTELIFYEATSYGDHGVWKYVHSTGTWTSIGKTLEYRDDFVAIPVDGISCP